MKALSATWTAASPASLLPLRSFDVSGRARAISNAGETVGPALVVIIGGYNYYDDYCYDVDHPMVWTSAAQPTDLRRNVGSETLAAAIGINSAHQVAGYNDSHHASIWSATSGTRDLGALPGRRWSSASAISDAGVVVGSSFNP